MRRRTPAPIVIACAVAVMELATCPRASAQAYSETVVHSFVPLASGAYPYGSLIQGSDGSLYGTTHDGGAFQLGTVFKISNPTTSPTETVIHSFSWSDGARPNAGLIQGSDGNLYGTTVEGGSNGAGTVFKITDPSTSPVESVIHSFTGGADGRRPRSSLIQASDGSLYGTTSQGGLGSCGWLGGCGTVFKISNPSTLPAETVIYSFTGGDDGFLPYASLIQASDGNLYGTTIQGGPAFGSGTVFEISNLSGSPTKSIVHSFTGGYDGATPYASLIEASDGTFYGTTFAGGASGSGTVYRITNASTSPTLSTIYSFTGGGDGSSPYASVIQATDGNLYGTAYVGGSNGFGTAFRINNPSTSPTFSVIYGFVGGLDGARPYASMIQASDGNLYGTTAAGGSLGPGTVFRINNPSSSPTETVIYGFAEASDGAYPSSSLLLATDGNLYGTTSGDGAFGYGTVYRISDWSTTPTESVIYTFMGGNDGWDPAGTLIQGSDGSLYGTTYYGGPDDNGTVFKISNLSTSPTESVIHTFTGGSDGAHPNGSLIQASDGNLYGTTSAGGGSSADDCQYTGCGTVFKISDPSTSPTESIIHVFSWSDGDSPGALIQGSDGNLYGTTYDGGLIGCPPLGGQCGTVFKISDLSASPTYSLIYNFTGGSDGSLPTSLIQASDGNLYGTTLRGGSNTCSLGCGTVFKIRNLSTIPTESVIHRFTWGGTDGVNPTASLLQASDGNLYGATQFGGSVNNGTVYKISDLSGLATESVVHSFEGEDGSVPLSSPIQTSDGTLWGTTSVGGTANAGTVFKITQHVIVSPQCGPAAGGTAVTITGSGFQADATVTFLGVEATVVSVTSTQITVIAPPGLPGSVGDVVVTGGITSIAANGWGYDFSDVPASNTFHDDICVISRGQITGGCGNGDYCPDAAALRKQMAVFVLKSKEGASYVPPAAAGIFTDVPASDPFAPWIEELYHRGVVAGCGPGPTYCPDAPVLRQQMAVFLLRTLLGSTYAPPPCTGIFPDVPCSNPFSPWIEDLYNRGIAAGCGGGNYCPYSSTTRGQMAVFLVKTFSLQ